MDTGLPRNSIVPLKLRNEIDLIFNNVDTNKNGYIELEEFIRVTIERSVLTTLKNIINAY